MSFLNTWALALSALALPILVLYMMRLRRHPVTVSSLMLWRRVLRDREANVPWQKLRRNLLMLLQLTVLAMLIIALARPYVSVPTVVSGAIVILLDASASMNATDLLPSRFDAAREAAEQIVMGIGPDETVTIITAGPSPEVIIGATDDRDALLAALRRATPTGGEADWHSALALAAAGARGAERFTLVVISDGGLPDDLPVMPGRVHYVPIGSQGYNWGVTALSARPGPDGRPQLFTRVTNFGPEADSAILSLEVDGVLIGARRLELPPGGSHEMITRLPEDAHIIRAYLTRPSDSRLPDLLPLDDEAWTVYEPPAGGRVLIVSEGNLFLERAFASQPGVRAFRASPEGGMPQERFDLYVLDSWLPPDGIWPPGDLFIINPPGSTDMFTVAGQSYEVAEIEVADDPRTAYLDLGDLSLLRFTIVEGLEWADVLIRAGDMPLLVAGERDGRKVAILTFALSDSDLPLRVAWPVLISNLLAWYAPARMFSLPDGIRPGETLLIRLPPEDVAELHIGKPDGSTIVLVPDGPEAIFTETDLPGLYHVEALASDGEIVAEQYVAVNLFSGAESSVSPAAQIELLGSETGGPEDGLTARREFWHIPVAVALILMAVEWWVYHRGAEIPFRAPRRA